MRSVLPDIAVQLGADERTLRRAARRGTVRCQRPGPRTLELLPGELAYLRGHWDLLSALTRAFRTEPNVRLAVLYGSTARGREREDSDIDVLVDFRDDAAASTSALARRLEGMMGVPVDVARLSRVRAASPLLLLRAVNEGRVLVDRENIWAALQGNRETIARAARRALRRDREAAADSLGQLLEEL